MKRWRLAAILLVSALFAYLVLRPVCVPLTEQDLAQFTVPIEQRTDRDFYLEVFQQRDGRWYQCKTWISRQVFF